MLDDQGWRAEPCKMAYTRSPAVLQPDNKRLSEQMQRSVLRWEDAAMQLCITTRGEVVMKRRSLLLALCSSAFISAPALADEVKQEADKIAVAYSDCVAKKDAACVAALYTKDGVQINPGGVFSDLKTVYENNFKNGTDHIEIRVGNMSVINNDLVVANGETDIFGKDPKSGDATKVTVFWGSINIREGGALKIRQLTVGMKPPLAKEASAEKK